MKFRLLLVFLLLASLGAQATDDPILFTVGDMQVTRSEFEQSYIKHCTVSRAHRLSVADYLESYIVYKLKVKAALDARLDATNSFKSEYAQCLSELPVRPVSSSKGFSVSSSQINEAYEKMKRQVGTDGRVCIAQILICVPQKARPAEQRQAQQQIEAVYREIQGGADFEQLARRYSQELSSSSEKGVARWYTRGQMLQEVENVAFGLKKGEVCRPFLSTIGYHILLLKDRKGVDSYEEMKESLSSDIGLRQLQRQVTTEHIHGESVKHVPEKQVESYGIPTDALQKEYYEGLLLFEQNKYSVGKQAAENEQALTYFFKKNKKKYRRKGFKPKEYTEVRELVVADLQEEMNKHWVADLRKIYPVNVNKKVLKTVNNHL
jgi:peptidyl-prolyl cis-trans isomerase SurA